MPPVNSDGALTGNVNSVTPRSLESPTAIPRGWPASAAGLPQAAGELPPCLGAERQCSAVAVGGVPHEDHAVTAGCLDAVPAVVSAVA
jgi:hypothetical protein